MSAPPSPHLHLATLDDSTLRKRDRPPALALQLAEQKSMSDGEVLYQQANGHNDNQTRQPRLHISPAPIERQYSESEGDIPRPSSATSSLAYYFGNPSREESPAPLSSDSLHISTTPETRLINEPSTPARDPAGIDRKGLIGVGELATPRWARGSRHEEPEDEEREDDRDVDDGNELIVGDNEQDGPDSPWTIEAVNSESEEKDEPTDVRSVQRTLRPKPSMTEESGGEEILYPRKNNTVDTPRHPLPLERLESHEESPFSSPHSDLPAVESESALQTSPPSAFAPRKAKKRTSDEFEFDNAGTLITKQRPGSSGGLKDKAREDKTSSRKHRSLGGGVPSSAATPRDKAKERRRDSIGLSPGATPKASIVNRIDKHARQTSASSSSSGPIDTLSPSRRVHTTDFSHLPPSPSSSSIQQFLHHAINATPSGTPLRPSSRDASSHAPANVAHSLLRNAQEGWTGMDDEATVEALRKLDGLSGKGSRARASVGGLSRSGSLSRSGTPAKPGSAVQWEGIDPAKGGRRGSTNVREIVGVKNRDAPNSGFVVTDLLQESEYIGNVITSSDDQQPPPPFPSAVDRTPKKSGTTSARSSFTPKRGSASSTNYTSTPTTTSSRDSAQLSSATSATSVSTPSGRYSTGKNRRNSAGSDISNAYSSDAMSLRDRGVSSSVTGDIPEDETVPPVPPLPKDLSSYKSPLQPSTTLVFPSLGEESNKGQSDESEADRKASLEVPTRQTSSSKPTSSLSPNYRQSQQLSPGTGNTSSSEAAPPAARTPSKKWSFSNALNIKLSSSPSASSLKESPGLKSSNFPLSPRSIAFGQRKSLSKDQQESSPSTASPKDSWSPIQSVAMTSAASLASLSSVGSAKPAQYPTKTPDPLPSRAGTESSASTHTTSALAVPQPAPLSPSSSVRRGQSQRRLTPSSIPFFRRSSSQSMHIPASTVIPLAGSPTFSSSAQSRVKASSSPNKDSTSASQSTPTSAQKKSSVLSLGIPSLLKGSSSRRSLHGDKSDSASEAKRVKDVEKAEKEAAKDAAKLQKEKQKKEDKERSESRISVMMGRKRGKTLSSTDPKKAKPFELPPMQMSAIPPATAQRVASLKSSSSNSSLSTPNTPTKPQPTTTSSRLTAQTASSMQKLSDPALRGRGQLPTIAGSPSVGSVNSVHSKEPKDMPPSALLNSLPSSMKETPTRIPRISSRTSAVGSPTLKNLDRRASVNINGPVTGSTEPSPIQGEASFNEFGVLENGDASISKPGNVSQRLSIRGSPSSRVPRQVTAPTATVPTPRKSNRDSVSFGLRKASVGSVASTSSIAPSSESQHRFSALSPSKGFKMLAPKMSLPTTRSSASQSVHQGSPSSSRQSLSTPSPVPSTIDEEELAGDEEMLHYIRRQQTKKMANGASQKELDDLLSFPDPLPPGQPSSPESILQGSQVQYLSQYERKEILDYPSVYCFGARSQKKPATPEVTTNNFGYDDERGDYLVVNHDHLSYRYEIIDVLGKGSFGQVLHCRDHCSGESVAIKIIRNKKRFHHQALVEIKILDNLRKWDHEEKHHVIKMTEHFYFRNHLCIAMELLSINLYELIKANGFVGFTTALIRRFTSQMLMSLQLMRHHRIVHCDLKPENVLLRHPAKSALKVIDFGSSCFEHEKIYTYIQSRFYRSPEVILGMNYHMAIDIWSLGCILAELYTGFPIFPGENEQEQLSCIMEVLGVPDKDFVNKSSRKRIFFDNHGGPRPVVNSKGRRRRPGTKSLAQVLRCNDEDFVDFIARCLTWDPEKRIKPQTAMRHPFITGGRRNKVASPSPAKALLSSSSLSSSRTKQLNETPKKSQISAPTPLTARMSRTSTNTVPLTPSGSSVNSSTLGSSSRSYRSSQSQGLSSSHFSSRTLNGYSSTASTK